MPMQMRSVQPCLSILVLLIAFTFGRVGELAAMVQGEDVGILEEKVALLKLGFKEYHVATKLTPEQKALAGKSLLLKSYPGTYTFTDGDVFILVEKERDTILAVYQKNEETGKDQMKQMIVDLMTRFGSPTSEAHDQIIYWAFGEGGKITDKEYDDLKQEGESNILATVKFKSKLTFDEMDADTELKNDIHCIVSAPRLLEKFYQQ